MSNILVPWHRVGQPLSRNLTVDEAIRACDLDFHVVKVPLQAILPKRVRIPAHGYYATMRTDSNAILGIVQERYTVVQNRESFAWLDSIVNQKIFLETGGVIDSGKKVWLLGRLKKEMRIGAARDRIMPYLIIISSHEGSIGLTCKPVMIRPACSNSIPGILRSSDPEIKIKHTPGAFERMEQIHELLRRAENVFDDMEFLFQRMSLKRLTGNQVLEYVKTLIPDSKAESNVRVENLRKEILQAHTRSEDHLKMTPYGLIQAVADVLDHKPTKDANKHLKNVWFGGSGEVLKERALRLAEAMVS